MSSLTVHPFDAPRSTKSDQARINGAKSKGPISTNGKTRSSRNALKHGLTAEKHSVLDIENPAEYKIVYDAAIDEFKPHSLLALRLVEELAHLDWRIERLALLETAYLNFKINEAAGLIDPEPDPMTAAAEGAGDFAALVRGWISAVGSLNALELLRRYTGTLQHQFNTTFGNLQKLETRAIARRRDRELEPSFHPPYQKPEFPEPLAATSSPATTTSPLGTPISRLAPPTPTSSAFRAAHHPHPHTKQTQSPIAPKPLATSTHRATRTVPTQITPSAARQPKECTPSR